MQVHIFDHSDYEYLRWLAQNRFGFVVNTPRALDPDYMMLHRAGCNTISEYHGNAERGGFTEREYIKICANDIESLRAWVRQNGRPDGSFSSMCQHCDPLHNWEDDDDDWITER